MWPIASYVSKLTPNWPENFFWAALYPVKPGKLGWGRAEVSTPMPNIISLARRFHLSGIILASTGIIPCYGTAHHLGNCRTWLGVEPGTPAADR